jgi:D-glycero-D-manno-heptose 1,7-bisphosphate phosphatase
MGVGQIASPPSSSDAPRLAIFDRDGTIIDVVRDEETGILATAFHPSQLRFLDGALEGLRALRDAGFLLAIATNQPGPAKGQCSAHAVSRTNAALVDRLAREGIVIASLQVCMHHPKGGEGGDPSLVQACDCRKPKAGMLEAALRETSADRGASWMIGDTRSDLDAARAAHVSAALIFSRERCELCPLRGGPAGSPDVHGTDLAAVAAAILAEPARARLGASSTLP